MKENGQGAIKATEAATEPQQRVQFQTMCALFIVQLTRVVQNEEREREKCTQPVKRDESRLVSL